MRAGEPIPEAAERRDPVSTGQNARMSPAPTDPPNGGARGDGFNAAKGLAVIAVAIILGVVLLQTVHSSSARSATTTTPTTRKPVAHTTTTTTPQSNSTTATTAPTGPVKTPDQLRVLVLNGGAKAGAAKTMSQTLSQKGYTNQADANTWSSHHQSGNTVLCRAGLDREAAALATTVGSGTPVPISPFPATAPPFSAGPPPADCVVVVGA
jgi:LytR cell envelope-related transcriptional attenuator